MPCGPTRLPVARASPASWRAASGWRGSLRLHRSAIGLDLLRAPLNVLLVGPTLTCVERPPYSAIAWHGVKLGNALPCRICMCEFAQPADGPRDGQARTAVAAQGRDPGAYLAHPGGRRVDAASDRGERLGAVGPGCASSSMSCSTCARHSRTGRSCKWRRWRHGSGAPSGACWSSMRAWTGSVIRPRARAAGRSRRRPSCPATAAGRASSWPRTSPTGTCCRSRPVAGNPAHAWSTAGSPIRRSRS